jgi:hypothetical protein
LFISTTARLFHSRQAQFFIAIITAEYLIAHLLDDMMMYPRPKLLFSTLLHLPLLLSEDTGICDFGIDKYSL